MTDKILTDDELKALFSVASAVKGGQEDFHKEVRSYDFKHPKLFVHEHIKTLEIMHRDFATAVSSVMTASLNHPVQLIMNTIREQTFSEYMNGLPNPAVISFLKLGPTNKIGVLEIGNELGQAFVDRMLGGQGKAFKGESPLTEIELGLAGKPLRKMLDNLNFSWKRKVEQINFDVLHTSTTPEYEGISMLEVGSEQVFVVSFEMKVGFVLGEMHLCVPHSFLKPFIAELVGSSGKGPAKTEYIKQADLDEVKLAASVAMGSTALSIGEFIKLQKGDVIPLMPANEFMKVTVGGKVELKGRLGRVKNKKAVQVVAVANGAQA